MYTSTTTTTCTTAVCMHVFGSDSFVGKKKKKKKRKKTTAVGGSQATNQMPRMGILFERMAGQIENIMRTVGGLQ